MTIFTRVCLMPTNTSCAKTNEMLVNTTTAGPQRGARVAMDSATGAFVVVWENGVIDGQRFNADGSRRQQEFTAFPDISTGQSGADVIYLNSGTFVIGATTNTGSVTGEDIFAKEYNAAGSVGSTQLINDADDGDIDQERPRFAKDLRRAISFSDLDEHRAVMGSLRRDLCTAVFIIAGSAAGERIPGEHDDAVGDQKLPTVAGDEAGDYVRLRGCRSMQGQGTAISSSSGL